MDQKNKNIETCTSEELEHSVRLVLEALELRYASWRLSAHKDSNTEQEAISGMDSFHQAVLGYVEGMLIYGTPPQPPFMD
jgi:hypothetical protein